MEGSVFGPALPPVSCCVKRVAGWWWSARRRLVRRCDGAWGDSHVGSPFWSAGCGSVCRPWRRRAYRLVGSGCDLLSNRRRALSRMMRLRLGVSRRVLGAVIAAGLVAAVLVSVLPSSPAGAGEVVPEGSVYVPVAPYRTFDTRPSKGRFGFTPMRAQTRLRTTVRSTCRSRVRTSQDRSSRPTRSR